MFKSNYFHYRWVETGSISPFQKLYQLGRSNSTAQSKGGVCIGAFLLKDGRILDEKEDGKEATQIVWAISRCSDKENYWRAKARKIVKGKALKRDEVFISQNYDYESVKKIANKLAEVVNVEFSKNRLKFWQNIKNSFNIDAWVANGFEAKNVVVQVDPIIAGIGGTVG